MKRIGILIPEFPGQTHNFFWREMEALKELGAEVTLFSTRRPPSGIRSTTWGEAAARATTYLYPIPASVLLRVLRDLLLSPARVVRCLRMFVASAGQLQAGESKIRLLVMMMIGIGLGRMCKDRSLQHLHVHSCADAANVALFAHAAFGLTYSMTLHNPLYIWGGNQANKWKHASFGIVIADWILQDLRARLGASLPDRLLIAPMGVNVQVFKRKAPYQALQSGVLKVFSCARLNPAKGFEVLLDAVVQLRRSGQAVVLTIAGEDDQGGSGYRKKLESVIADQGLGDAVRLLGAVPEERVRSELEDAHVFVLASFEEPLGVAIMEAMAMEVPVVSTRAGGVPGLISDGVDGFLVPPSDATSLSQALAKLASTPELAVGVSSRGRARIEEAFHHRLSARVIFEQS